MFVTTLFCHLLYQFRGIACTCVAAVQASQVPDVELLQELAAVADDAMGVVALLKRGVDQAATSLEAKYRSSASATLYT